MLSSPELPHMLLKMAGAFLLGLPLGWEREEHSKFAPGLRTFPLVSMGACAFVLVGQQAFPDDPSAQAYVFQAILSGIGFFGGGAIIKAKGEVQGIATAATIWITAGIGTAVAYGVYWVGLALSLVTVAALWLLKPLKSDT
jgi:putative Mg2+ transporter-C (MgtC) family protein